MYSGKQTRADKSMSFMSSLLSQISTFISRPHSGRWLGVLAITTAIFSSACGGGGYAVSMADLAKPPLAGGSAFLREDVAAAVDPENAKSGYYFTVVEGPNSTKVTDKSKTCNGSAADPKTGFFATGDPAQPGTTGTRFFGVDETSLIKQGNAPLPDAKSGSPVQ